MMDDVRTYACPHVESDFELTGRIDHPAWSKAPWTADFVDIQGSSKPRPRFRTRAKMLWSDTALYVAAELEEPHVWGTLTEHDSVIFQDNDFEIFLDPDGDNHFYAELEVNVLNTTWDLLLPKPYRNGGPAVDSWEWKGLQTAVHVNGTINDPSNTDHGWTVEFRLPFRSLKEISRQPVPPRPGDVWRINFSRVQWRHEVADGKYKRLPGPEDNWVWSPQGVIDMHQPERWGMLQFTDGVHPLPEPKIAPEAERLMRLYHAQAKFRAEHGRYGALLEVTAEHDFEFEGTHNLWLARLGTYQVDHESRLIWSEPPT